MTDLFDSPVLLIGQPSAQLNYQITDPQGAALAHVIAAPLAMDLMPGS